MSANILIVDDDENIIHSFKRMLRNEGHTIYSATDGGNGLLVFADTSIDVVLVDYQMPGMNGIEMLKKIKQKSPSTQIIIITGYGTIETAVDAMKLGAYDYITKPLNAIELRKTLRELFEKKELVIENRRLQEELKSKKSFSGIVGQSPPMLKMFQFMLKAAESDSIVLIQGESGTGKEMVARAIHDNSKRMTKPFVVIDCSSISGQVIESELFGHVKGAFTNAIITKKGLLEEADHGTVFIDEITEIPFETQSNFLRVLQEREIRAVGSNRTNSLDIRVIAATNKDITQEVKSGRFRLDLFYRLNIIPITIPPLRDRPEDIPLLVRHFMELFRTKTGQLETITTEAISLFLHYSWPGNVRELRNVIERIFVLSSGKEIEVNHLPTELRKSTSFSTSIFSKGGTMTDIEKVAILNALDMADGNRIQAAHILGVGKSTLYRKIKQYGIA